MIYKNIKYGGFWVRFVASVIDTAIFLAIITPLLLLIYGREYLNSDNFIMGPADLILSYIFPIAAILAFWHYKSATPGKLILSLKIVDAKTLQKPTTSQFIIRYIGYFVSMLPLFLGFLWVAFDRRKQSWHDKLAGTVVIRKK